LAERPANATLDECVEIVSIEDLGQMNAEWAVLVITNIRSTPICAA
jgi:hypothetical protein